MKHALHTALDLNPKTAREHRLCHGRYRVIRPFWDSDARNHSK